MTLLICVFAAIIATVKWYQRKDDSLMQGVPCVLFWGASLMWLMDFVFEYKELKADYFVQEFADILNDSLLGIAVTALGLVAWVVLLIKDPKGVFKKKFINKK